MAYNTKALLLLVGFLLATALLGSSEVLTHEQLAQNHAEKTIHKESITYRCIGIPERPCIPGRRYPYVPGRPYIPGAPRDNPYRPLPPSPVDNEINSGKPHH
ncbi:hypothetical protein M6B38_381625 [Iris pallida]|uniref:Uncharacterized protein n=1 Tax=Iris pallida TaxID=29817 RepID=A0AAX6G8B3_IRIPA|nr:hypothetical protein M6B38_381625 [Iris pallida]